MGPEGRLVFGLRSSNKIGMPFCHMSPASLPRLVRCKPLSVALAIMVFVVSESLHMVAKRASVQHGQGCRLYDPL
jgi:hypothetical protein